MTPPRLGTLLVVLAIALVTWRYTGIVPGIDADWNWVSALAFDAKHGLRFGDRIVWTYGPLGFLENGPLLYYGDIALLTFAFQWIVQVLLAGTLFLAVRRSFHALTAVIVAVLVTTVVSDRELALGVAWCALWLARDQEAQPTRLAATFPLAIGVLTGIVVLGKLNQGIELTAVAVVALVAAPSPTRRRDGAIFAAAASATAAVGWVMTGQSLGDVWPYLRYGKEIVSGYPAAMGLRDPTTRWAVVAALLIGVLALVRVLDVARGGLPRRRVGLLALWAIYTFLNFKEGFVRQDSGHVPRYFTDMLMLLAVLPARPLRRTFALTGVACCAVFAAAAYGPLVDSFHFSQHVRAAVNEARTLASRNSRGAIKSNLRRGIVAHYAFPSEIRDGIGRQTVAFWPHVYGDLAYAYDLNWRPLPVLEPYSAYTPALDRLDTDMLSSAWAPQRIVRSLAPAIDSRVATFEAPLATLAILCRYRQLAASGPWSLLARAADRCGAPAVVGTVSARWGQQVAVPPPRPGTLLLARVDGAGPHGLERLRSLLLRPQQRWISLDGKRFRLIDATAPDGLLLRAPANADYPGPYAMAPNPTRIAVSRDGGDPGGTLRYTFVAVPVRPFPPTARAG